MQVLRVNRSRSQTGFTHEIDEALADEAEAAYDRCTAAATPFERPSLGLIGESMRECRDRPC